MVLKALLKSRLTTSTILFSSMDLVISLKEAIRFFKHDFFFFPPLVTGNSQHEFTFAFMCPEMDSKRTHFMTFPRITKVRLVLLALFEGGYNISPVIWYIPWSLWPFSDDSVTLQWHQQTFVAPWDASCLVSWTSTGWDFSIDPWLDPPLLLVVHLLLELHLWTQKGLGDLVGGLCEGKEGTEYLNLIHRHCH